ncbi:MAG: ComEC/Rec2 family competence protein [Desulfuromonadales bacterium]|nr:ComEC/Rec2 family competence protein [Desulfuromonadales bacterium]
MTVGEKKGIPQNIRDIFNATGTSHILAISGLHVGIIAFLSIFFMMTALRHWQWIVLRFNIRIISHVAAIFPVVFYALIAGGGISVIRATIMILTFMLALLLGRGRDLFNTLAMAGFMILIITPYSFFDVSFQLSFSAVAAILLISPVLMPKQLPEVPSLRTKIYRSLMGMGAVSFSAILGTWPLVSYYFNIFSPVALLANLLAVPIFGFIALPLSLAGTIAIFLYPPLAIILFSWASQAVAAALSVVDFLAALPYASLVVVPPAIWQALLYWAFLIVITLRLKVFRGLTAIHPSILRGVNYAIPLIIFIYLGTALFGYA